MIDDKLWGVTNFTTKTQKRTDTRGWPKEVRSCRICGRMADAVIHPDAYEEWQNHRDDDDAGKYLGVKVVKMGLNGLCCDNCHSARELYLTSKDGVQAIALELMRINNDGESSLSEKQEEVLMVNLRSRMRNYCEALRRMNGFAKIIFDEKFVRMVWERPKGCWRTLRGMSLYLYKDKPIHLQFDDSGNWLKRVGKNS